MPQSARVVGNSLEAAATRANRYHDRDRSASRSSAGSVASTAAPGHHSCLEVGSRRPPSAARLLVQLQRLAIGPGRGFDSRGPAPPAIRSLPEIEVSGFRLDPTEPWHAYSSSAGSLASFHRRAAGLCDDGVRVAGVLSVYLGSRAVASRGRSVPSISQHGRSTVNASRAMAGHHVAVIESSPRGAPTG